MIDELIATCKVPCIGGFVAYWNDSPLYPSDPAAMFRKAVAILVTETEQLLLAPIDLTQAGDNLPVPEWKPIEKYYFGGRSTGALFFKRCYFSIREGDWKGSYQITADRVINQRFRNEKAYTDFLKE